MNQKGGVGKTTLAANTGVGLTRLGRSVILADLDPQGHLTRAFGAHSARPGLHEVLTGRAAQAGPPSTRDAPHKPGRLRPCDGQPRIT